MKIIILFTFIFVLFFNSCSSSDNQESKNILQKGNYSYLLTDSSGVKLVEGIMTITEISKQKANNENIVSGSYTIDYKTEDTIYTGLVTMRGGELSGYYNDEFKRININTNPKLADANIFINAKVKKKQLEGTWHFSTFRGSNKEGGFFKAQLVKN